ncbi:hypothetical protein BKA70DRAFT_1229461 [Coprinopsis sp. MPI-PUGE-AT-0042]|nr:hypothetical protein BKA70DRAFT_1229461 [Coprinopsis sp. MPI-PUGE-AT-0042]
MSTGNASGVVADNSIWEERHGDEEYVAGAEDQPSAVRDAPADNLRRSGKGEYVGMDMHTKEDDDDYGNDGRSRGAKATSNAGEEGRVLGGYKATVNNPRVSDEAKEHAQEVLERNGESA